MNRPPVNIPKDLKTAARIFADAGYQCWLVGGAVRDGLLGRGSEDYDLATDAPPEIVIKLFHRTIPTGIKHGTVTILMGSHQFETTTFRTEGTYSDGRRPDEVSYSTDIMDDLARRDFTINAIAWNLIDEELRDPHNGRQDLDSRIIRAIGEPAERFDEDALRSIRACRFAAQLDFTVHPATMEAIKGALLKIPNLSPERIWEELKKILAAPEPSKAFNLFRRTGLLSIILPEVAACIGVTQKGRHVLDVFDHSLKTCDTAPRNNFPLRAAALFHDIGKPPTKTLNSDGEVIFHGHESAGAELTEGILRRFKASNAHIDRVTRLVRHHMFHYTSDWTDAAVRRFMVRIGLDILDDLLALRVADASSIAPDLPEATSHLLELLSRVDGILDTEQALSVKDLCVNGGILMKELGIDPGPKLGTLLDYLLDCVLEDPNFNEEGKLLELGRRWLEIYG
ncbi:MAG: CCA tRNA nucleotidyltransferase [Spirochaetaceae bacterium]|nr:CCA tRNA nucleotidyltransferase [Spirochaetaceae bacterium]MDT8296798.1 CCA tRNA nucleotidyltransferase [Spirochaetaceae bacterium]